MQQNKPNKTLFSPNSFGSLKNGRNFSVGRGYKYGMNTQLKDDEVFKGAYTAEFWEYDSRLGRRWNLDPVTDFSSSSYQCFNNNPILFSDHQGDIFKIGTTDGQAKTDVQSLAKSKNRKYLDFNNSTGEVTLNFKGVSERKANRILRKDPGLDLINKLSKAKDGGGNDLNFYYGTDGPTNIGLENPEKQQKVPNYYSDVNSLEGKGNYKYTDSYHPNAFVMNASSKSFSETGDKYGLKPLDNFDGKVFIGRGEFQKVMQLNENVKDENGLVVQKLTYNRLVTVTRAKVVFHELNENILRTMLGYCYEEAHKMAGGMGDLELFYPEKQ